MKGFHQSKLCYPLICCLLAYCKHFSNGEMMFWMSKCFFHILCFFIFCFTIQLLVNKYSKKKVSIATEKITTKDKRLPSLSFCPYPAMKERTDPLIFNDSNLTGSEILQSIRNSIYKKNETFFYVSYQTRDNPGFECLTTKDSHDGNKPCAFPSTFNNQTLHECDGHSYDASATWCWTKVHEDGTPFSQTPGSWGNCSPRCKGKEDDNQTYKIF